MYTFYVASYGEGDKKGIYITTLHPDTMQLEMIKHVQTKDFPSYMISQDNSLFVTYKNASKDNSGGGVGSFQIHDDYTLALNTEYDSSGRSYTHLCVDPTMQYLFAANYHAGTTASYALQDNRVTEKITAIHHTGMGPDALKRQTSPHVHYVGFTPDQKYVYAVDLGADKVVLYTYQEGILKESNDHTLNVVPGSGPRHMIFSKDGKFAYLVNEIENTLMVFKYVDEHFTLLQVIHTVPRHFDGFSAAAAIRLSSTGKHLFISNRGHDSIALYRVNQETGKVTLLYMVHTGKNPRDFNVLDDRYLIVGVQEDNALEVLTFDEKEEKLVKTESRITIPQPVCITIP